MIPAHAREEGGAAGGRWQATPRPAALARLGAVRLDVRDDIRAGREPFARIMGAARDLGEASALVVRAPFEPRPLYEVLGRRGFAHWTERHADDDWSVWFYQEASAAPTPGPPATPAPEAAAEPGAGRGAGVVRLDVRDLEAPVPMIRILEAVDALGPGGRVEVIHARRPMLLYPLLDQRGVRHTTDEPAPGVVRIVIEVPSPPAGSAAP